MIEGLGTRLLAGYVPSIDTSFPDRLLHGSETAPSGAMRQPLRGLDPGVAAVQLSSL